MKENRVTVLCGGIKGSTFISRSVDAPAVSRLPDDFFDISFQMIDRELGVVSRIAGDGFIAFFSGEGQATRAVRAAMGVQEKARQFRSQGEGTVDDPDLHLRIGIATGTAGTGEPRPKGQTEYSLDGEVLTLAARLQGEADPGDVLISAESREEVRESFVCEEVKDSELKDCGWELAAYRVRSDEDAGQGIPAGKGRRETDVSSGEEEARRHRRKDTEVGIRYSVSGYALTGRSVNISASGLLMDTDAPAPVGTELVIYTEAPIASGDLPDEIHGKIVRIADDGSYRGVAVEFQDVKEDEAGTTSRLPKGPFEVDGGMDGVVVAEPGVEDAEEWGFSPYPLYSGATLPLSYEELGTGTPDDLVRRLSHEIKRARRYGTEFSLMALKVDDLENLPGAQEVGDVIRDVDNSVRTTVRNTDDITYFRDGFFLLLAPETVGDRAETLAKRVTERVGTLPGRADAVKLRTGVASFDGDSASSPRGAIAAALERCS